MATDHVLTTASSIVCGHGSPPAPPPAPPPPGTITIVPPAPPRLTVSGNAVLALLPDTLLTASVALCPLAPPAATPCAKLTGLEGAAGRLTVGGLPVLLANGLAPVLTGGPPAATPAADAGQTLLRAE